MVTLLKKRSRAIALGMAIWMPAIQCNVSLLHAQEEYQEGVETALLPPSVGLAAPPALVHQIRGASERMELTANTSRIIKLEQKIPKVQVNNKDLLDITPLSPNEVQIFAKKPGVTQINLWDEVGNIHTIDVVVYGDARELEQVLASQFPRSAVKVRPIANSVILGGYVDNQEYVSGMVRIAEDYYPKVINNITVGGVQQIALHVKVMEVSRTKLRTLGMDWSYSNGGDFIVSGVSGMISAAAAQVGTATANGDTIRFGFVGGNSTFFGFLNALRRYELMKVLAEPTLTTVSGRPAFFNAGGEFPILIPQSLGTVSIQYQKYGTQVDFVPIVLGNGNIRLEVKPRVSEIDQTRSVTINGTTVPGLRVREVDTAVEMKAGQTLALAGLVQNRVESIQAGIPWISDVPYLGVPFRKTADAMNEVELLVLVTPQYVNAVDCSELPPCGPGSGTVLPRDCDFYGRGFMEVPAPPPCGPAGCGPTCNDPHQQQVIMPGMQNVPQSQPQPQRAPEEIPIGNSTARANSNRMAANPFPVTTPGRTSVPILPPTQFSQPPLNQASAGQSFYQSNQPQGLPEQRTATRPTQAANAGFIGPVGYDTIQR
jgi:pilus assembly protein CpaC